MTVAIIAVLAALLWIGGEMHYRNCVNTAVATTPLPEHAKTESPFADGTSPFADEPWASDGTYLRRQAVAACSRSPL